MCAFAWIGDVQKGQTDTFKYSAFDCVQFDDAWPWNFAEIWIKNISFDAESSDGYDYLQEIGKSWKVERRSNILR